MLIDLAGGCDEDTKSVRSGDSHCDLSVGHLCATVCVPKDSMYARRQIERLLVAALAAALGPRHSWHMDFLLLASLPMRPEELSTGGHLTRYGTTPPLNPFQFGHPLALLHDQMVAVRGNDGILNPNARGESSRQQSGYLLSPSAFECLAQRLALCLGQDSLLSDWIRACSTARADKTPRTIQVLWSSVWDPGPLITLG